MSNLIEHAKTELSLIKAFDEDGDFYGGMTGTAVLELVEVFSNQGHSGMSAGIVANLFSKCAKYEPLSPLTFNDDEWSNNYEDTYQNKRNSAVFKEGKDGKPYYIDAYHMIAKGRSGGWNGSLPLQWDKRVVRCYIKDPSNMPKIGIELDIIQHSNDASDWDFIPAPRSVIAELEKYYEVEIGEKE